MNDDEHSPASPSSPIGPRRTSLGGWHRPSGLRPREPGGPVGPTRRNRLGSSCAPHTVTFRPRAPTQVKPSRQMMTGPIGCRPLVPDRHLELTPTPSHRSRCCARNAAGGYSVGGWCSDTAGFRNACPNHASLRSRAPSDPPATPALPTGCSRARRLPQMVGRPSALMAWGKEATAHLTSDARFVGASEPHSASAADAGRTGACPSNGRLVGLGEVPMVHRPSATRAPKLDCCCPRCPNPEVRRRG